MKMQNKSLKKSFYTNKGFSLIELIIVIMIIAILTAIIVPNFIKYYERARKTRDLQAAEIIGTTFERILALNPDAEREWNGGQLNPNSFFGFAVEDYYGNKYYLANVFEYTMTQKGEIATNARDGMIRDAHEKDPNINFDRCKELLIEELTTNVKTMAYQGNNLRSFRLARNMNTGEPEVWICYVPKRKNGTSSDGEGTSNGWVQYRAWPNPDPRYLSGEKTPIFQAGGGRNVNNPINITSYTYEYVYNK